MEIAEAGRAPPGANRTIRTGHRRKRTNRLRLQRRSLSALYRDIQPPEGAGAPLHCLMCHCEAPMGPWRPEREARGSALGVQSWEGSYVFAGAFVISNMVLRDCHVGLRPPRNDKSGAITVLSPTCTYRQYSAGPGCPLPYNALLILRTGPAWHRGKWPHGRGADIPALSCNTGETPAPSRCRGRGPRA